MTSDRLPESVRAEIRKRLNDEIYRLYWHFASERQAVFFRRLKQTVPAWTSDPILQQFKFTNAYRASDRVSQFLIRRVIYNESYSDSPSEVVFRILLFKFFNKISTWTSLERALGALRWQSFDLSAYDKVLLGLKAAGHTIYSAAYIIPPVALSSTGVKHQGHLKLIKMMMENGFASSVQRAPSLEAVYNEIKQYPSLGSFLAFQFAIDLNYSTIVNHGEDEFVVAGPGARDGIAKVFHNSEDLEASSVIRFMMEEQDVELSKCGIPFRSLWGRKLQLIDCQNLFCEVSKYTRVSNPEVVGSSGRTRIKQVFRPQGLPEVPWFPPKWNLNAIIERAPYGAEQMVAHVVANEV
jgi:hypothetical protein